MNICNSYSDVSYFEGRSADPRKGVWLHDVSLGKEVLVVAPVLLVKCGNPRASELLGHKV